MSTVTTLLNGSRLTDLREVYQSMSIKASKRIVTNMLENIDIKYFVLALWVFMTMTYILESGIINRYAGFGRKITDLEERASQLKLENMLLEVEIASASALRHIDVKAREMGFGPTKVEYIK